MSPTYKPQPRTSTPTPRTSTPTHSLSNEQLSNSSLSSSIPSLPDVHKPPSGARWGFLQTLLAEDEQGRSTGQFHPRHKGDRRGHTKDVIKSSRDDSALPLGHKSDKAVSGETLTARSDKLLTASWSGSRGMTDKRPRGERRGRSQDGTSSPRQLSGSLPAKKKFRHRLNHVHDPKQSAGSRRRFSSPATTTTIGSSVKSPELGQKRDGELIVHGEHREDLYKPGRSADSEKKPVTESEKSAGSFRAGCESQGAVTDERSVSGSRVTKSTDADSARAALVSDNIKKGDNRERSQQTTHAPLPSSITLTPQQRDNPLSERRVEQKTVTVTTTTTTTQNKTPTPSDPINQWTTCRALDDSGDDDDDNDSNNNDEGLAHSDTWTQETYKVVPDSSTVEGIFSRATSSNLARRKRPLLLPPIMLPPIYTVKPTPLKLRDDVYFASSEQRARRPISDEEWDKLRDCRYLRIRTRRTIKV